ncbi:MAG: YcxB family protein [Bacillota bacterium]
MEEAVLTAYTEYTYAQFRDFVVFSMFKGKNSRSRRREMLVLFPLLVVMLLAFDFPIETTLLGIIVAVVFTVFVLVMFLGPRFGYKYSQLVLRGGADYTFRAGDFTVENKCNPVFSGRTDMHYAALHSVYETKDMFYLFITAGQAYLVDKGGLRGGAPEELRERIRGCMPNPKKYVICV